MKFHFMTKDFYEDYNIIGWMPQPEDLSFLKEWKPYNGQDYPELLVRRTGSTWIIYATSLPTGRKDYMQRNNKLHLIITGTVDEGSRICGFLKEVYPYLQNEYNNNESSRLLQITSSLIKEGNPVEWAKQSENDKGKHAQELGSQLEGWGGSSSPEWEFDEQRWYGGDTHSRQDFQTACEFLLTHGGNFKGAAVSLLGIGQREIDSFIDPDRNWEKMAILVKSPTPRTALPEKEPIDGNTGTTSDPNGSDSGPTTGTTISEDDNRSWNSPEWVKKAKEWWKEWWKVGSMIIIVASLLFAFSLGISSYNKSCNNHAIAQVEKTIQEKQPVDQKLFDRVCKLADKNNSDAEFALGCYYLSGGTQDLAKAEVFFNRSAKHGNKQAPQKLEEFKKTLEVLAELADENNPEAEFTLGCYYLTGNTQDLKKAEDFFNRAVENGSNTIQEKANEKLEEIKKLTLDGK